MHTGLAALVYDGVDILHVEKQVLRRVAHKVAPLVGHHDLGVADLDHCTPCRAVSMRAAGTACGSHTSQATAAGARLRASTGRSRPGACRPRWRQTPPAVAPPCERCDRLHATAYTLLRVRTSTAGGGRAELMKICRSCCSWRHALRVLCTRGNASGMCSASCKARDSTARATRRALCQAHQRAYRRVCCVRRGIVLPSACRAVNLPRSGRASTQHAPRNHGHRESHEHSSKMSS